MPSLPDRYGREVQNKAVEDDMIVSDNMVVSTSILAGTCGIAVMTASMILKRDFIYDFMVYALQAVEQNPAYFQMAVAFSMASGLLTFAVALALGFFALKNDMFKMKALLIILAGLAVITLATGATMLAFINVLDDAIEKQAERQDTSPTDDEFQSNVAHFQFAIFNVCCADKGWSDMPGRVEFCDGEEPNFNPSEQEFESCFADPLKNYDMNYTLTQNREDICGKLEDVKISIEGVNIPGTSIRVKAITDGQTTVNLVGPFGSPEFGCGNGIPVAFQVATFLWFRQRTEPLAYTALSTGVAQIIALLFAGSAIFCSQHGNESSDEAYRRYMREIRGSTRMLPIGHPGNNGGGSGTSSQVNGYSSRDGTHEYTNNAALRAAAAAGGGASNHGNRSSVRSGMSGMSTASGKGTAIGSSASGHHPNVPVAQPMPSNSAKVFDVDDKI